MKRSGQMKVKKQGNRVWVELETEKEMRIYMHPLRQRILDLLARNPNGMSAKKVADALQIAPSSAGHHLRALQDICLVEEIRTEKIHGFEAKIYGGKHDKVFFAVFFHMIFLLHLTTSSFSGKAVFVFIILIV